MSVPGTKQKEFNKLFESLIYTQARYTVFEDFLDFSLLMLSWSKKPDDFKDLESRWPKVEDQRRFAEMLMIYVELAEGYNDPLGDLFMEYLSNDRKGQFFTPMSVCHFMAHAVVGDSRKAGETVYDPACGSGRTLLAAAKINPELIFYAGDIDKTCCKMCVLNMMVNQMEGEVAWMDSLGMKHWQSWHLRKVTAPAPYDWHSSVQFVTSGPGETEMIVRIKNTLAAQAEQPKQKVINQSGGVDKPEQLKLF